MTSLTRRLQDRIDSRPDAVPDRTASRTARRILIAGAALSVLSLGVAFVGLVVDPRTIGGEPGWIKPAKFGVSIALYLVTLQWIVGQVRAHRHLLTGLAVVIVAAFAYEVAWIDIQVVRGTTSHFNAATAADATAFNTAGIVVSLIFLATFGVSVLALRTRGLDAGIAAGIRWGLAVSLVGMAEAVSMVLNGSTDTTNGAHTVGGPDGGPGLPVVGWSLAHGDLRIAHFVGLHALQVLPLLAWALLRFTPWSALLRRALMRVAGTAYAGVIVVTWWQAERGQALLHPDVLTLAVACGVLLAAFVAGRIVFRHGAATAARSSSTAR